MLHSCFFPFRQLNEIIKLSVIGCILIETACSPSSWPAMEVNKNVNPFVSGTAIDNSIRFNQKTKSDTFRTLGMAANKDLPVELRVK